MKEAKESLIMMSEKKRPESDDEIYSQLYEQVVRYFDEHKPYTNPNFKLGELAVALKCHQSSIGKAIKANRRMNFSSFCNLYRINLAKKLLESGEHKKYTMQYVQMSAGFQTQPTFNHVFKKVTGFSPSEYGAHLKEVEG